MSVQFIDEGMRQGMEEKIQAIEIHLLVVKKVVWYRIVGVGS